MNEELKTKAKDLVTGWLDIAKDLLQKSDQLEPQGFFIIQTSDNKLSIAPIVGFSDFYRNESSKNIMQMEVGNMSRILKSAFQNGEKIFAFAWVSEAWYYSTTGNDIMPASQHQNRKEAIAAYINYLDENVIMMLPFIRIGKKISFEPVIEVDRKANITGRFANLLGS